MLLEFTRELAYIVRIGTEVQIANRTFVLATPTAFALTNYHNSLQAHFFGDHDGSVRLQDPNEKRLGDHLVHGDSRFMPTPEKFIGRNLRYERKWSQNDVNEYVFVSAVELPMNCMSGRIRNSSDHP
jgi:hypothetical protein